MSEVSAARVSAIEARVNNLESATSAPGARIWNDKYADNHRLRVDLDNAHAEIRRLGGVIPEPCGPILIPDAQPVEVSYLTKRQDEPSA